MDKEKITLYTCICTHPVLLQFLLEILMLEANNNVYEF